MLRKFSPELIAMLFLREIMQQHKCTHNSNGSAINRLELITLHSNNHNCYRLSYFVLQFTFFSIEFQSAHKKK